MNHNIFYVQLSPKSSHIYMFEKIYKLTRSCYVDFKIQHGGV